MSDWLRKRVRIWPGYDWRREGSPVAEGVVIAFTDQPTIVVRDDHGNDTHHVATLPIDVLAEDQPVAATGRKQPSGQFGIWRTADGGLRLAFYRPDGLMTAEVTFDQEAAQEFASYLHGVMSEVTT